MGTALMAMILTDQFNRSENIVAANKLAALQQKAAVGNVPVDPSADTPPVAGARLLG